MSMLRLLPLLALALGSLLLEGSAAHGHLIIFKDGFVLNGDLKTAGSYIADPATGEAVFITRGGFTLDAQARRIYFSPTQVQDALKQDASPDGDIIKLANPTSRYNIASVYPLTAILGADDFNDKWERKFKIRAPHGNVSIDQRIGMLTPHFVRVDALKYNWSAYYSTNELGVSTVRSLLYSYPALKTKSAREDPAWRLRVARFFIQAGWFDQAEEELAALVKDLPTEKDKVEEVRADMKKARAIQLFDDLERAQQAGQFHWVKDNLGRFPREGVDDKLLSGIRALRASYETSSENLANARRLLKDLPLRTRAAQRRLCTDAAVAILDELDHENVARLDAFLTQGLQAEREQKQDKKPSLEPDQLMALAISGWLMGKELAEPKIAVAARLWKARAFVLKYLVMNDATDREQQLKAYLEQKTDALAIDELTHLIGFLPPPVAEKTITNEAMSLKTNLPDGRKKGIAYVVQLPPEYHHGRPFPVLFALHHTGEKPRDMLTRLGSQAAQNGYILVAPEWAYWDDTYNYTAEEHDAVLQVLRDLRRRFQVDSDRVFLLGCGEGGNMAYDVGLSHPDLFAGVLPMAGCPLRQASRYWPNCLHVPFYVVDGDLSGNLPKHNQNQFKKWVPMGYPALYVQYKGRGMEWFGGELPTMFDWMNHKKDRNKRSTAFPELGKRGGSLSQEIQAMRSTDTRFYWLSTDGIREGHVVDGRTWDDRPWPATLYGRVSEGNVINVTVRNLKQVSVWLARDMIDFSKPVTVRVNDAVRLINRKVSPSMTTLLEDLYARDDRQRLFWARLDFDRP
jgi:predicted esterase